MQLVIMALVVALVSAILVRRALLARRAAKPSSRVPPAWPGPFANSEPQRPSPTPQHPTPPSGTPPTGVPARLIPRRPVLSAGCARTLEDVEQLTV